jgi:hypothetical protein
VLEGIGDQAITSGVFHLLEGGAKLAGMNPAGAAEMAAGGALIAFGAGLSGMGSKMPGGSNAGGNAFASRPSSFSRPAEPTMRSAQPQGTTSTIIVNVNTLVADEHTGEAVIRSIESAHRAGRRINPHVLGAA